VQIKRSRPAISRASARHPLWAKDLFGTRNIKTTWGAEPFQDQVPTYTCTAIDRLEKAGAVLLAKLSMARWRKATNGSEA